MNPTMPVATHEDALQFAMQQHAAGRIAEADAIYRQLLAIYPDTPELLHLVGVVAGDLGNLEESAAFIRRAITMNPGAFAYRSNLGRLLTDLGQLDEALAEFAIAIHLAPQNAEVNYNHGNALHAAGRAAEAVEAYRVALRLDPNHKLAKLNLGNALVSAHRLEDAVAHYRAALQADPGDVDVANNLANILRGTSRVDEAIRHLTQSLAIVPNQAVTLCNLGCALKDAGDIRGAIEACRQSLKLNPDGLEARSNLIFTSLFDPALTKEVLMQEHGDWERLHALPLRKTWCPHTNDRTPDRRLRIGYVSADLRDHVVGRTLLPCFEAHDRSQFDIICYSGAPVTEPVGERFRQGSAVWREVARFSDERLAAQIREDRIDVLIDLSLHTAQNRVATFARKPAPVQIAWLGYPGPSGLSAMDYWIADPYLSPPESSQPDGHEKAVRLSECWCSYGAPGDSPAPGNLPASRSGSVTFGSFNNIAKLNESVTALWAEILRNVEGSRLLLLSKGVDPACFLRFFGQHGVAPGRVEFLQHYPLIANRTASGQALGYLDRYRQIDIALDPFPYNGMTTTCDALWMGVPVVALTGDTPISRASFSLLSNIGLPELAATSEERYMEIAVSLARDLPRLESLRATLRGRMKASPLLDAPGLARNVETAFRAAWRKWCATQQGAQAPA